jgi:hypothetical protein
MAVSLWKKFAFAMKFPDKVPCARTVDDVKAHTAINKRMAFFINRLLNLENLSNLDSLGNFGKIFDYLYLQKQICYEKNDGNNVCPGSIRKCFVCSGAA